MPSLDWSKVYARLQPGPAEGLFFVKDGRRERVETILAGGEAPEESFYGFLGQLRDGSDARMLSVSTTYAGVPGHIHRIQERTVSRLLGINKRKHWLDIHMYCWKDANHLVSLTDHFSIALGDYFRRRHPRPLTIGCFHCLSDLPERFTTLARATMPGYLRRAISGLDFLAFTSPADREEAIRRYSLHRDNTAILQYGIDTAFWRPEANICEGGRGGVFSVGSDPNRDFATIAAAPIDVPVHILTRLDFPIPPERCAQVSVHKGSFHRPGISDAELRIAYHNADVVAIPLRDTLQATGCNSVLQAMACGRPVIVSNIKGLWAPEHLIDGENCLLVPPGDPGAMAEAVDRVLGDHALASRLGSAARRTAEAHFSIADAEASLRCLLAKAKVRANCIAVKS